MLHEETGGIEEGDILIAYNQHQLGETQEYHAIMGEEQRLTMQRVQQALQQIAMAE